MLRNYLIIALRSLWRNRLISFINLVGMALGFGIFMTFWSIARFDLGFDDFHEDVEQLYVLHLKMDMDGSDFISERTGGIYASVLPDNFPQILTSCRLSEQLNFDLGVNPEGAGAGEDMRFINEDQVVAVDSTFLELLSFPLIKGDEKTALREPDHIVLTRSLAMALFGKQNPLGKEVSLGGAGFFTVAGVTEDPPENSTYQFNALVGFHVLETRGYPLNGHGGTMYYNNFRLEAGSDIEELNVRIQDYIESNFELGLEAHYYLGPITDIHLFGDVRAIQGVYMYLVMAFVILLIAIINFVNLSTAYSSRRFGEITIRKSVGAGKRQLVVQFMGETYLLLLVAFYLGFFFAEHLLPRLSGTLDAMVEMEYRDLSFWLQIIGIFILSGLLAGLYPAVKIAGFRSPRVFSKLSSGGKRGRGLSRTILTVMQFTFSIVFIIVAIFMMRQFEHLQKADLGFNREEVLYMRTQGALWNKYGVVKQELQALPYVEGVSTASSIPVFISNGDIGWGEREDEQNKVAMVLSCDEDFLSTFEIEMNDGRFFYPGSDSLNRHYVVVNRSLINILGWEDPVGRSFYFRERDYTILGVIEDIDFFPFNLGMFRDQALIVLYEPVRPFVFIRTSGVMSADALAGIEEIFTRHNPGYEFDCDYVSNYKYEVMENEEGLRFTSWVFSVVAVVIALMGIIGLSVFNNQWRTKELGIRKVMGARDSSVLKLLLRDFLVLVLVSNAIGMPLAWLAVKRILQIFTYTIDIEPGVFIAVLFFSLLVSLGTVVLLGLKTVRTNPVDSLRYE